jgi:hypothetical protein
MESRDGQMKMKDMRAECVILGGRMRRVVSPIGSENEGYILLLTYLKSAEISYHTLCM